MIILPIAAIVLLVLAIAVMRQSRGFRGSGAHFADEQQYELKTSKGYPGPQGGDVS